MGIPAGGKNYKLVASKHVGFQPVGLTFLTEVTGAELRQNGAFVQNAITLTAAADERQRALWQDRVRLDEGFWRSLREHPVPVREEAVAQSAHVRWPRCVYLARLPASCAHSHDASYLDRPACPVRAGFKAIRQLKPTFRDALGLALAVYPEARVDLDPNGLCSIPQRRPCHGRKRNGSA